jgi:chloramphenicol 3-O-phosphotransferase
VPESPGKVVLFGGPAGAGKSTVARAWCAARETAAHVELDAVRGLIVSGLADPQKPGRRQDEQYMLSAAATCGLARTFADAGVDVAVDDVLEPDAFEQVWRPLLDGLDWRIVIVLPALEETLARSTAREKRVLQEHTRRQHERCSAWPAADRIDTTGLSVADSLRLVEAALAEAG